MNVISCQLKDRWSSPGGYREIFYLSIPLIFSAGSWSIQLFFDRMFLTWLSPAAIAAAMPAGMVNFTLMSFFFGTTIYINTFIAQYTGAKMHHRIGPAVWQGIFFALLSSIIILPIYFLAPTLFHWVGHEREVQALECTYFRILIFGGFPLIASHALASFFSGRGKTWTVMWVTISSTLTNIILDYALIFGKWGFPSWGMKGAAVATVFSQIVRLIIYMILISKKKYREKYHTWKGFRYDPEIFHRLIRFGIPNGLHYLLEMIGFTLFILIVGQFGTTALAATNIAFNISTFAFMPMMGFGMALSIYVGQNIGKNQIALAVKGTWSTFHMAFAYMVLICILYLMIPHIFLLPYASNSNPESFPPIAHIATILLRFVAIYSIFDTMNIIFASAIKGAGDTRFIMWTSVSLSWLLLVIPTYLSVFHFEKGIYTAWTFASIFITALGITFLLRFIQGKWKTMKVIENTQT